MRRPAASACCQPAHFGDATQDALPWLSRTLLGKSPNLSWPSRQVTSLPLFPVPLKQHNASRKLPLVLHRARTKEHGTAGGLLASLPKALCCRTHSHLGTAGLSWCRAGFTGGMGRERNPWPHHVLPAGLCRAHQSAGAVLTMLQTLPPISCWIPVSLPAPTSAKQSVKIEAGLHQNTIVNCSLERSPGRRRIALRAGEKECLPGGQV